MKTNWKAPILAALGLIALAVAVPVGVANAQTDQQQGQRGQGGFQGGQTQPDFGGMPPEMMMQRGMMGGGQATMVVDNAFLYILQGNQLYKVNKNTLEVVGQGQLPMPGPQMGRGGAGGAPGVRGGGAGGATRGGGSGAGGATRGGGGTGGTPDDSAE